MKRIMIVWAFALLSLPLFAQFGGIDVEGMVHNPNQYLGKQQKEIGNTIRSEVEAQARAKRQASQTSNNPAVQNYNNRISAEGQQRMEYYNNPDNYIDRSVTNRGSSYNSNELRSLSPQTRDLRTEPIHSEALNSKSLQMLREANREQFSSGDRETAIDPSAEVPLFEAPSLGDKSEAPTVDQSQTPVEEMDMEAVYEELTPGQKAVYDRMKKEIFEQKEDELYKAEVWADMAKETVRKDEAAAGAGFAIKAEKMKEKAISKAKDRLRELDELAREAVRNNRKK